jgi:hypothetical protein
MRLDELRDLIRKELDKSSVYRTDDFVDRAINNGYRLIGVLSLFDERRGSSTITGGRNYACLPTNCIVPLYMANTDTGTRVHPVSIDEMEFYSSTWEGRTATDSQYYTVLNPFSSAFNEIVVCPYQTTTEMDYTYIGAYESTELSSDSDEPRLPEEYQDLVITYAKFESFIGEPGMVGQAEIEVKRFLKRMNEFIASIKSRFPSGRDYEPYSAEFNYSVITEQQMKPQQVETKDAG